MKASIALLALPLAAGAATCAPAQAVFKTGNDALDALVLDITGGRRDAAIARISSIESLSGKRTLATTPSEFVDRLIGCRPEGKAKPYGFDSMKMIEITWSCPGVRYRTIFDPNWARPYITVGEFEDQAAYEARRSSLVPPPAPPPPAPPAPPGSRPAEPALSDADKIALLRTVLGTLVSGDPGAARAMITPDARITFGRRDPIAKVTIAELDGTGPDAFVAQARAAIAKLGKPVSIDCDAASCRFAFAGADRILIALAGDRRGKLSYVQFFYAMRGASQPGS